VVQVETKLLEDRQAQLVVTVEPERVEKELKAAANRIARKVNIPGFRKGKAPFSIIKQYFGEGALFEEALDKIGQEVYSEALDQTGLEPFSAGNLEDIQFEPFVITFTVPLMPVVDLGEYRSVRIEYETPELNEEDIDNALQELREGQATMEPADRPVDMGDVAEVDIKGTMASEESDEPEVWLDRKNVRVLIKPDATYPVPGFPQEVIGMEKDQERSFSITLEENDDIAEDMIGKTIDFEVMCNEVLDYTLPELDDEFAKSVGDYETLESLREELTRLRQEQIAREARNTYLEKVFEELDEVVTVEYPGIMLEGEIDDQVHQFEHQLQDSANMTFEDYLKINKVDEETVREDFKPEAEKRIRRGLILAEVVGQERLTVKEDDIEDEIATMVLSYGQQAAMARQFFSNPGTRRSIRNQLLTDKALDRLAAIAKGEEPEIVEEEEAEEDTVAYDEQSALEPSDSGAEHEEVNESSDDDEAVNAEPEPDAANENDAEEPASDQE